MCLGLTVPMMLFVGGALTSGGRASADRKVATAGSLQSRLSSGQTPAASPGAAAHVAVRKPARRHRDIEGAKLLPLLEPDTADSSLEETSPHVVLGPQLEADPAAPDEQPGVRGRLPAIPTGTRPRAEIVPDELVTARPRTEHRIEAQLDEILSHLDRLTTKISNRQAAIESQQSASELLARLQEARQAQQLAAKPPVLSAPDSAPEQSATPVEPPGTKLLTSPQPAEVPPSVTNLPAPTPPAPQTKIYRPRYIAVRALETLVTPLLTADVGRIGSASSETEAATGDVQGGLPTQWDALVVRDTPEVLRKIDRLVQELDVPPVKILIEATVLTVRLNPSMPYGVDLGEFNAGGQPFSIFPAELAGAGPWGTTGRPPNSAGIIPTLTHGTGVKCGILRGDARAFLQVLQAANQIRGTAASQVTVVNKQTTEILLSDGFAAAADGARPLSAGTVLRVRPIATRDGLIHLEMRPVFGAEGTSWTDGILAREGTLSNQLTLRSGETAVVSGFIADHLVTYSYKKSGMGELPFVGHWFRGEAGVLQRTETIVLLTPHLGETVTPISDSVSSGEPPSLQPAVKRAPSKKAVGTRPRTSDRISSTVEPRSVHPTFAHRPAPFANVPPAAPTSKRLDKTVNIPAEIGSSSNQARQTSASATPDDRPPKKLRAPVRRPRTKRLPPVDRNATELDEIPEIPAEPSGPLIRPAAGPRSGQN